MSADAKARQDAARRRWLSNLAFLDRQLGQRRRQARAAPPLWARPRGGMGGGGAREADMKRAHVVLPIIPIQKAILVKKVRPPRLTMEERRARAKAGHQRWRDSVEGKATMAAASRRAEERRKARGGPRKPGRRRPDTRQQRDRKNTAKRAEKLVLREAILDRTGRCCVRCGFADTRALQIDHIQGDGARDHGRNSANLGYYRQVLRSLSTGERRYQVLCANCNWIKAQEEGAQAGLARGAGAQIAATAQLTWL